jgi:(p)ppGpp synthase/HD superfamily hydrolase
MDGGNEMTIRDRALVFAFNSHEGQVRKYNGEPYICHPIRVAAILKREGFEAPGLLAAAFLHDVVEDCGVTVAELEEEFGSTVAALVDEVTNKFDKKDWPDLNRKERKHRELVRLAGTTREAKLLKMADIIDNFRSIDPSDDFTETYLREKTVLLEVIEDASLTLASMAAAEMDLVRQTRDVAKAAKAQIERVIHESN